MRAQVGLIAVIGVLVILAGVLVLPRFAQVPPAPRQTFNGSVDLCVGSALERAAVSYVEHGFATSERAQAYVDAGYGRMIDGVPVAYAVSAPTEHDRGRTIDSEYRAGFAGPIDVTRNRYGRNELGRFLRQPLFVDVELEQAARDALGTCDVAVNDVTVSSSQSRTKLTATVSTPGGQRTVERTVEPSIKTLAVDAANTAEREVTDLSFDPDQDGYVKQRVGDDWLFAKPVASYEVPLLIQDRYPLIVDYACAASSFKPLIAGDPDAPTYTCDPDTNRISSAELTASGVQLTVRYDEVIV